MKSIFNVLVIFFLSVTFILGQVAVPNDWYYGNPGEGFNGISMKKAYGEFLKDKKTKTVVVAVIDSGIDIEHADLAGNIWVNPGEIPDNGQDDDKNGYIDDIHGWNFIGGPDGKNVGPDTYEATRVYASLKYKYENANAATLNKEQKLEYDTYLRAKETVDKEIEKANAGLKQLETVEMKVMSSLDALTVALGDKPLTTENLEMIDTKDNQALTMAKNIAAQYLSASDVNTIDGMKEVIRGEIAEDKKASQNKLDYAYNINFDPRKTIVKDNYADPTEKFYGNNDVEGPDPLHGTHVAGIIGAIRDNSIGMDGVAPNVKLMSVRAVPDGDERDKDVANAIRYAVDNGATVINMSFGKGFGTHKNLVDEAVKYAAKKDVLLVHAAGNSGQNNDQIINYPNSNFEKKSGFLCKKQKKAKNWVEVGALNYKGGEDAAAPFSNYGIKEVDLFAPGMKIYSTMPNNEYAPLQGTSMASPVVAGVAATLRSVFPALTAEQVKEALLKSVTPITQDVKLPGSKTEKINFSKLSVTGGVVNLDKALTYASTMKGKKKIKEVKA
ncbi:MAG: S8 family peptidase [Saprospiraceae bacterium]|nr:S8 family peptidase [Saprospiraceae bacterium]